MVHAGCVFDAGIYPSTTWMSGSFESLRWNACVHKLNLGLYSRPKEFGGHGVRNHADSKGKIPSTGASDEVRTHISYDSGLTRPGIAASDPRISPTSLHLHASALSRPEGVPWGTELLLT